MTLPHDRLAGYADGELDPPERRAVEEWLATHPEGAELLRAQEQFSPANTDFWKLVEPQQPDPAAWSAVRRRIADDLRPRPARRRHRGFAVAASVLLLAGIGVGAWLALATSGPTNPEPREDSPSPAARTPIASRSTDSFEVLATVPREVPPDPLAEYAVLPMAEVRDVLVESAPGNSLTALPLSDHPLPGVLPLATPGDVRIEAMGRRPDGTIPPLPWMSGSPMIYAAGR